MALPFWREQDLAQLREVAGRIAAIAQTNPDRRGTLTRLAEAAEHRNTLADLLIEYSGRWFIEGNGQSILIDPDLYWLLTESDLVDASQGTNGATAERGNAKRARGMLLMSILDHLARSQRPPENPAEHGARNGVPAGMNAKVVSAQPK